MIEQPVGYCGHSYRRDIESCPYCELAEAEQKLSAARAEVERLQRGLACDLQEKEYALKGNRELRLQVEKSNSDWLAARAQLKHMEDVAYERLNLFTTAQARLATRDALLRECVPVFQSVSQGLQPVTKARGLLQRIEAELGNES